MCEVGGDTCYYAHAPEQLRIDMKDIQARATRRETGARAASSGGSVAEGADR